VGRAVHGEPPQPVLHFAFDNRKHCWKNAQSKVGRGVPPGKAHMRRQVLAIGLGMAAVCGVAAALAMGDADEVADETATVVVLGEEDLADRAEILRNRYRRMTPGDAPLVQDVGTWPAAWEEFSPIWDGAAAERDLGTWTVPVEAERDGADTVLRDGAGVELWRGQTDFSKDGTEGGVLTGALVAEEDWPLHRAAQEEWARRQTAIQGPRGEGGGTNALRFTAASLETDGSVRLSFAWEENGNVEVFARAMNYTSWVETVVWTNDENEVATNDFTHWRQVAGEEFRGTADTWQLRGVVAVSNGVGEFVETGLTNELERVWFFVGQKERDADGDGLTDGGERWTWHTDPENPDTDGDGWTDGEEALAGTDPLDRLDAPRLSRGVLVHAVKYAGATNAQWVQLHCSGPRPVDVSGFRLQAAGTAWETVATFPEGTWMVPGHFLLVGDVGVLNADVTAALGLAGSYSNQPTAGVRLTAPAGSSNAPVDTMFYGTHVPFNEQGLETAGWLSDGTHLWASGTRNLERWHLGLDTDTEDDWRHVAVAECHNSTAVLDSDGDALADGDEYMSGLDPLDPDMDGDGLLDGFEVDEGLDPTNPDTDGDGIPDGDESAPGTQLAYSGKQRSNGLSLDTDGPENWGPGGDLGLGGTVTYTLTDVDGFAVWGTIWEGGSVDEDYTVSVQGAEDSWQWTLRPRFGHTITLVFAVPDGTNAVRVVVTDDSADAEVTTQEEQGADIDASFKALRLNVDVGGVGEETEEDPGASLANRLVHSSAPRTECRLSVTSIPFFTYPFLPGQLSLSWDSAVLRAYDRQEDGTLLPSVTALLGDFRGTNLWLEGIVATNTAVAWRWNAQTNGQDWATVNIEELHLVPSSAFGCPRCLDHFEFHLTNSFCAGGVHWSIQPDDLEGGATLQGHSDHATLIPGSVGTNYIVRVESSNAAGCFAEAPAIVCVPGPITQIGNCYTDSPTASTKEILHLFSPSPATDEAAEHFCFVQFLRGFMKGPNGFFPLPRYGDTNGVAFNFSTWQIDSSDDDPAYYSPPHFGHTTYTNNTYYVFDSPKPGYWAIGVQCNVDFRIGLYCASQTPSTGASLQPSLGLPFDEATWDFKVTVVSNSPGGLVFSHP